MICPICGRVLDGTMDFIKRLIDNEWVYICYKCDYERRGEKWQ